MRFLGMDRFEQWLETELHRASAISRGSPVPVPCYSGAKASPRRSRIGRVSLALAGSKLALAATATVALAAGGVAAKAVTTGDPNPLHWGSTVTNQVAACKAALPAGQHGIGSCVSSTASQHGPAVSDSHSQGGSESSTHTPGAPASFPGKGSSTGPPSSRGHNGHPGPSPGAGQSGQPHGQGGNHGGPPSPQPTPRN